MIPREVSNAVGRIAEANGQVQIEESNLVAQLNIWCVQTSQQEVARAIDVSPSYLNDILHGRRGVTALAIRMLEKRTRSAHAGED